MSVDALGCRDICDAVECSDMSANAVGCSICKEMCDVCKCFRMQLDAVGDSIVCIGDCRLILLMLFLFLQLSITMYT